MAKMYIAGEGAFANIRTSEELKKKGYISVREINKHLSMYLKDNSNFLLSYDYERSLDKIMNKHGLTNEEILNPHLLSPERREVFSNAMSDAVSLLGSRKYRGLAHRGANKQAQEIDNSDIKKKYLELLTKYFNRVCLNTNGRNSYYFKKSDIKKCLDLLVTPRRLVHGIFFYENWNSFDKKIFRKKQGAYEKGFYLKGNSCNIYLRVPNDAVETFCYLLDKKDSSMKYLGEYTDINITFNGENNLYSSFKRIGEIMILCNMNCELRFDYIRKPNDCPILTPEFIQENSADVEWLLGEMSKRIPSIKTVKDLNAYLEDFFTQYKAKLNDSVKFISKYSNIYIEASNIKGEYFDYKDLRNNGLEPTAIAPSDGLGLMGIELLKYVYRLIEV